MALEVSALLAIGLFGAGVGLGSALGWALASRRITALRRAHAQREAELRNHVLPVLEQRASAAGVPPSARARDVRDPLVASVTIGRAIQELESRRDLPFTDTVEVSKDDITAEVRRHWG
jgi:hypothetical protein